MTSIPCQMPSERVNKAFDSDLPQEAGIARSVNCTLGALQQIMVILDEQHLKNIELEERVRALERPKVTTQCNCFANHVPGQPWVPCPVHNH